MTSIHARLQQAIPVLTAAGIDTPRLDAELLLAHVTVHPRAWVLAHPEYALNGEEEAQFSRLLARRQQREPRFLWRTTSLRPDNRKHHIFLDR